MPTTAHSGISYTDLDGYTERYSMGMAEAVRICQVLWSSRVEFAQEMLGYSKAVAGKIQRVLPEKHPEANWLYATEMELVRGIGRLGQGGDNSFISYGVTDGAKDGYAVFNVRYRALPYDIEDDAVAEAGGELVRFVERSRSFAVENITVQGGTWTWSGGGTYHETTTKLFGSEELMYTWHDVPAIPSQLTETIGKVNDAAFDLFSPEGGGYTAQTLLCMPAQVERTTNPFGERTYRITYKFLHRSTGWNNFYRPDVTPPAFQGLSKGGVGPYLTDDFDDLFVIT